jgi:hypothetical protein
MPDNGNGIHRAVLRRRLLPHLIVPIGRQVCVDVVPKTAAYAGCGLGKGPVAATLAEY